MRIELETKDGELHQGTVALKDESFIFLKTGTDVKVFHWIHIKEDGIRTIIKGVKSPVRLNSFKKIRE